MIQDIYPKVLNNDYRPLTVTNEDLVMIYRKSDILIKRVPPAGAEIEIIDFSVETLPENAPHDLLCLPKKWELPDTAEGDYRYLFEISGIRYFLYTGEPSGMEVPEGYHFEEVHTLWQDVSKDVCFAVATGYHLHSWYRDNRFCGRCGHPLVHDETRRRMYCPHCGKGIFPVIAPGVIVAVYDGDRLLLTKYADRVYKRYALISGYTEIGETPEQTVEREVLEEVGLKVKNIRYYKSQPWGVDSNVLMGFFAELDGDDSVTLDAEELAVGEWFHRDQIPVGDDHISLTREMVEVFKQGRF